MLVLFLLVLVVVALAVATHYRVKINQLLKREYEDKRLLLLQLQQVKELQRRNQELSAENKVLKQQGVSLGRAQFLANLN